MRSKQKQLPLLIFVTTVLCFWTFLFQYSMRTPKEHIELIDCLRPNGNVVEFSGDNARSFYATLLDSTYQPFDRIAQSSILTLIVYDKQRNILEVISVCGSLGVDSNSSLRSFDRKIAKLDSTIIDGSCFQVLPSTIRLRFKRM